jgi:hypothetical protein
MRRDDEIRDYRRRAHNHHQSTLLGGGHGIPAMLAHASARVRSLRHK